MTTKCYSSFKCRMYVDNYKRACGVLLSVVSIMGLLPDLQYTYRYNVDGIV